MSNDTTSQVHSSYSIHEKFEIREPHVSSHIQKCRAFINQSTHQIFSSPTAAGRKIIAGFSYVQKIGKSGTVDVWFPIESRNEIDDICSRKIHVVSDYLHAEWAAIRQFELLQESGNYKIFDMQSENIARTLRDLTGHMRGGGYRIIVATMGRYLKPENKDDLQILDERLQARIARLIHMMFLEEQSEFINHTMDVALIEERWDVYHVLPHLGVYLGARDLFSSHANIQQDLKETDRKHILSRIFLDIVNQLPTNHIVHDIAVGLQLPELINENEWIYLPEGVDKLYVFNNLMLDLFRCFDGISLSRLDGREDAGSEPKTTMSHMRSYGDRMTPENKQYYRKLLHFMM